MDTKHTAVDTSIGELTLVVENGALTGLYFPGHWHLPPAAAFGARVEPGEDPLFAQTVHELEEYLGGSRRTFEVPVATAGNAFSERVWAMLREIPFGETVTYGELAERIGGDRALARRVGQSVGWNPVSIFIPCHRVIGANGSLTGYAGGLERKQRLLELEGALGAPAPALF